ncbi:hypothetical protein IFR11_02130 [Microbacterium sp. CFBP 8801]|nr:hypothetical protein [Microbacterium sp. CFBP 8801]
MDNFWGDADVRIADHVDPLDAFHAVTRALVDASRHTEFPLGVDRVWAKADDGSTTLQRESLESASAELATMGLGFDYAFQNLEGAPRDSITVFVWRNDRRVMVSLRGPDRVRVEGLRAAARRYLDSVASDKKPRVEMIVWPSPNAAPSRRPWWKRPLVQIGGGVGAIFVAVAAAGLINLFGWN